MEKRFLLILLAVALLVFWLPGSSFAKKDKLTVAYYPGWPCSYQVGEAKGWFEEELGMEVDFRDFDTADQIAMAVVSGDIDIAYSLGIIPFISGLSMGTDMKLIGIAVSYAANDNCVAKDGSGIVSPRDLKGKKVGVPFSSVSHYKLLKTLEIFGRSKEEVDLYDMAPQDITAAFMRGDLDCGCAWEPAVSNMLKSDGHLIVSAEDQERWGIKVFDIICSNKDFVKQYPELITKFLEVTDRSTRYLKEHPDEGAALIAKVAGIEVEQCKAILQNMKYLEREEQVSQSWLGTENNPGLLIDFAAGMSEFLKQQGEIDKSLSPDTITQYVDPSFYEAVDQ